MQPLLATVYKFYASNLIEIGLQCPCCPEEGIYGIILHFEPGLVFPKEEPACITCGTILLSQEKFDMLCTVIRLTKVEGLEQVLSEFGYEVRIHNI